MIVHVNITYILAIDIVVWIVFHLILDVILHKRERVNSLHETERSAGCAGVENGSC